MPRRPAKVTQADIARALRAAKETGADAVTIDSEGVIRISLRANATPVEGATVAEQAWTPSEALQRYTKRPDTG